MHKKEDTKWVKQEDTWSCLACVAAMAVGKTLQDVIDFVGHNGSSYDEKSLHPEKRSGFDTREILGYLLHNNLFMGCVITMNPSELGESLDPQKYDDIEVSHNLRTKAMFVVDSPKHYGHCLYFDGETFFDPYDGPVDIKNYKVKEWWPIMTFKD